MFGGFWGFLSLIINRIALWTHIVVFYTLKLKYSALLQKKATIVEMKLVINITGITNWSVKKLCIKHYLIFCGEALISKMLIIF